MKYGIVGSRRWVNAEEVFRFVKSLPPESIIVSGGCKGVDTWAEKTAISIGLKTIVFKPELSNCKMRYEFTKAYYARNELIAKECDVLVAFVAKDRKGGTENTIKHAQVLGKEIIIIDENQ